MILKFVILCLRSSLPFSSSLKIIKKRQGRAGSQTIKYGLSLLNSISFSNSSETTGRDLVNVNSKESSVPNYSGSDFYQWLVGLTDTATYPFYPFFVLIIKTLLRIKGGRASGVNAKGIWSFTSTLTKST